ncbi:MAG: LysR substrate-binding domain-containing protein [Muribaculaceae bacterium]|nr:LysR substrate-binding domain-containing protein [Muribaculaceae bacterium]
MELRQLRYFLKVAETLNFSEAAKALFVTQSTLSQQVKQLEDELGVQLLTRSSHSVALTEAGEIILDNAKRAIYETELCVERICDLNNLSKGTLNIGVTYSFSPLLTETILTFIKMYPNIKLNICYKPMNELMAMLKGRKVDLVLAFRPTHEVEGIESHVLFQNKLSAVVGINHPIADKKTITLRELEQFELALPSQGLQARNVFDAIISPGLDLKVKIELNEVNILLNLVKSSRLVSVLAEATIHNTRDVKAIPLAIPGNDMEGCVHILSDTYHKKSMLEFVRILSESPAVIERRNSWL